MVTEEEVESLPTNKEVLSILQAYLLSIKWQAENSERKEARQFLKQLDAVRGMVEHYLNPKKLEKQLDQKDKRESRKTHEWIVEESGEIRGKEHNKFRYHERQIARIYEYMLKHFRSIEKPDLPIPPPKSDKKRHEIFMEGKHSDPIYHATFSPDYAQIAKAAKISPRQVAALFSDMLRRNFIHLESRGAKGKRIYIVGRWKRMWVPERDDFTISMNFSLTLKAYKADLRAKGLSKRSREQGKKRKF
jgi:hypothetical protein